MTDYDSASHHPQDASDDAPDDNWLKAAADWWSEALSEAGAGLRARLDAQAKIPKPDPGPLTDFDRHFQELAAPRLAPYVRLGSYLLGAGLEDYRCAYQRVMDKASDLGAMHLSDTAFYALRDWIGSQLLAGIEAGPPEGAVSVEQLAEITGEPRQ